MNRQSDKPIYDIRNVNGRAHVAVGHDVYGSKVGPRLSATRFGGRVGLSIDARDVQPVLANDQIVIEDGRRILETEQVRTVDGRSRGERHRFYELEDDKGFEWDTTFYSFDDVPVSGLIKYDVDAFDDKGESVLDRLGFHYQPPLTQAEIDGGEIRPDNIVGSLAVYWNKTGRHMRGGKEIVNYENGKFCNIDRPYVVDANGEREWCSLGYSNSVLMIQLPTVWMLSAAYPVTLDPTFGYLSIGGSSRIDMENRCLVHSNYTYTAVTGDVITEFNVYGTATDGGFECGVYNISGGVPQSLLTGTGTFVSANSSPPAWNSVTGLSQSLTNGVTYGVATYGEGNFDRHYYDVTGNNSSVDARNISLPATWSESLVANQTYSLYATYEAAPAGGGVPVILNNYRNAGGL